MKLENEFSVNVPLERAWETLLDIQTVAGFLPGAKIEPTDEEGVFKGAMKIRVGPMSISYQGTARLASVDEENRTVDLEVRAKEAKGQGTAAAVIHNQVVEEGGATRVIAVTDLQVTGRQAQFGRGIMQDVAGRMLTDFAQRFEAYLLEGGENGAAATAEPERPPRPPPTRATRRAPPRRAPPRRRRPPPPRRTRSTSAPSSARCRPCATACPPWSCWRCSASSSASCAPAAASGAARPCASGSSSNRRTSTARSGRRPGWRAAGPPCAPRTCPRRPRRAGRR